MRRKLCLIALICTVTFHPVPCLQDSPGNTKYRIVEFLFEGLTRCPSSWPEEFFGKGPGDVITIAARKSRAGRLLKSGLFADVRYKYLLRGSAMDITFSLVEEPWDTPVKFDNFIWFEDDALHAAIARVIPGYEGRIPRADSDIAGRIMRILDGVLEERGIAGRTENLSSGGTPGPSGEATPLRELPQNRSMYPESPILKLSPSTKEVRFAVKGPPLPICSVDFVGEQLPRNRLEEMTRGLLGAPYSRRHVGIYSAATIEPLFLNLGYLDVDVHESVAEPYASSDCDGVRLSLTVETGITYRFDGLSWKGDLLIPADVMESGMRITKGSVCNEGLIRSSLDDLLESYGALGYLRPTYSLDRHLDREARRVVYDVDIKKGPVCYMGTLRFIGLSRRMEERARSKWELASGQVFDSTYPGKFLKNMFRKPLIRTATQYELRAGQEGRVFVDVSISYEMKPDI